MNLSINKDDLPLITVVVPAYNASNTLPRCLKSLSGQTYTNLEIIVVNDGSTDNTGDIAHSFARSDSRISVITQDNLGLSGARNSGIDNGNGEFIYFVDADDFIKPDTLFRLRETMYKTNADLVVGGFSNVDTNLCVSSTIMSNPMVLNKKEYWAAAYTATDSGSQVMYVVSWGKLYKYDLFESERFDVGRIHEDEYIIHRIINLCECIAVDSNVGYMYIQSPAGIMHTLSCQSYWDSVEAILCRTNYFLEQCWSEIGFKSLDETRYAISEALFSSKADFNSSKYQIALQQFRKMYLELLKIDPMLNIEVVKTGLFSLFPTLCTKLTEFKRKLND